jgi:hypothetical protein
MQILPSSVKREIRPFFAKTGGGNHQFGNGTGQCGSKSLRQ